ncbi:hypothetical protein WJX73_010468 [Symbiochloris irregularis]|uniref:Uncharacterized protein n=1 Tax=Symbiochloris irregularis TaxID=706552 RepID=A0AAW1PIM1_9CHLO
MSNGRATDGPSKSSEEEDKAAVRRSVRPAKGAAKRSNRTEDGKLPLIYYKEGQALKDLAKLFQTNGEGQVVEVRIAMESMTNANVLVRSRQLWGNGIYTQDSDLVAVLMHCGFYNQAVCHGGAAIAEMRAHITLLPPQKAYASCARNNIRSRAWGEATEGCSYQVDRCWMCARGGAMVEMASSLDGGTYVSATFAPAAGERPTVTRSHAHLHMRTRPLQEVTVQFNLCNEPWLKYSMLLVADQGLKAPQWTSARLLTETLFLETARERFELSRAGPPAGEQPGESQEAYRFGKCKLAWPQALMWRMGIPLPADALEAVQPALPWEAFQWGPAGMYLNGQLLQILRIHFAPNRSSPPQDGHDATGVAPP